VIFSAGAVDLADVHDIISRIDSVSGILAVHALMKERHDTAPL
jgi:hypothetical protein